MLLSPGAPRPRILREAIFVEARVFLFRFLVGFLWLGKLSDEGVLSRGTESLIWVLGAVDVGGVGGSKRAVALSSLDKVFCLEHAVVLVPSDPSPYSPATSSGEGPMGRSVLPLELGRLKP